MSDGFSDGDVDGKWHTNVTKKLSENKNKESKLLQKFPEYALHVRGTVHGLVVTFNGLSKEEAKALLKAAKKVGIKGNS